MNSDRRQKLSGELLALIYIAIVAATACGTGAFYLLFPELAALSHDVLTRPRGTWASAPFMLAVTPVLTGAIGILITRTMPYGYGSVLLVVGGSIGLIVALKSPIAPALSAGLLPLVLGVKTWWYPPGILFGTSLLAILSLLRKRIAVASAAPPQPTPDDVVDDVIEMVFPNYYWLSALMIFVVLGVFAVKLTGLRLILFPPLVVIGFEMFGHTAICPWAKRPMVLPVACFLTAAGGFFFWTTLGVGPAAAACSMAWGILVLRVFDLHVPPALAVALLPLVMDAPTILYPISVGIGTLLITLWFLAYKLMALRLMVSMPLES
ncbi:MAG TPA: hypothetical protein VMB26_11125 [Candidatus Binataceae bacterium]|nr:hypothetical protein [Candidatus Binataceae bacterium]